MANIRFQKIHPEATIPCRQNPGDAGLDLYTLDKSYIFPGCTVRIPLGIKVALPPGTVGYIKARSSSYYRGLDLDGVIDEGYRGELMLQVRNTTRETMIIDANSRIAQLIVQPIYVADVVEVDELEDTARGEGGFGSTGG